MASIKLTVNHLYQLQAGEKQPTRAVARVYVGQTLLATEEISGLTEEAVSKYLHHSLPEGQSVRVEWDCAGNVALSVEEVNVCPCCHEDA